MSTLTLIIGNKAYSSWSLRPWLLLKQAGIPFTEKRIPIYTQEWQEAIGHILPAGKVPVLCDGDLTVWDTLAICEYLAESFPDQQLWPSDRTARAVARAVSAEMHSSFADLRHNMNMNCRKSLPGLGRAPGVQEDIDRITALWHDCRTRFGAGGEMLFGRFSIADAMYAPVATRFTTYGVPLDPLCNAMQQWIAEAHAETEVIEQYEHNVAD
ncbi:MAG: glutathione S-transferase [Halothiobacillaceae bacterium]|nr:MAG: glutathione S-transferase [Halothiobacillaceae bacterium]